MWSLSVSVAKCIEDGRVAVVSSWLFFRKAKCQSTERRSETNILILIKTNVKPLGTPKPIAVRGDKYRLASTGHKHVAAGLDSLGISFVILLVWGAGISPGKRIAPTPP